MVKPYQLLVIFLIGFLLSTTSASAQGNTPPTKFANSRVASAFDKMEDSVKRQFASKNLAWPPQAMYVRSFKYDRQLEVWVKDKTDEAYKLFKTYKVCMVSGTMGPKRIEGDYQVPEGFYHIDEFNPNSLYHLSLGISYPNASDKILSDPVRPGSAIYIHGNCVSTGCIPITDIPMEELYIIGSYAKMNGQEFIPVHIFPVRYNVKKSADYLAASIKDNAYLERFNNNIKTVFDYFETKKELPLIMVNRAGEYVIN